MQKLDLDQIGKLVRKIVREEVETESKDSTRTLEAQIRLSGMQLQRDIGELDNRMKNVEVRMNSVEKEVKGSRKDIRKLQKNMKMVINTFDYANIRLAKRVGRIEQHLALPNEN